nr:MAG TPA: hypothetical protein [Caudoviricetes sp.]DAL26716.1 MAG TPA_asm: hypothetical protein [Caudoviricetes sp.]
MTYTFPVELKKYLQSNGQSSIASLYKQKMPWLFSKLFQKNYAPDRKNNFQMRLGR